MSTTDSMMPLLTAPWPGPCGEQLPTHPLPGLRREVIANLDAHWIGTMTPEMCQLLQWSCGLSQTSLGGSACAQSPEQIAWCHTRMSGAVG
jgi:hypothetical protein